MNIVKELCIRAGLQQKQLAIMVGVSQPTVSDWINQKKDPSGERLEKLSEIFGVSRAVILGYDKEEKEEHKRQKKTTVLHAKIDRLNGRQQEKIEAIVDEMLWDE